MKIVKMASKGMIFRNDWHKLGVDTIKALFKENLDPVAILPGLEVVNRLKQLEVCTLEILEDRSSSTVYRIRQTDEVFQIFQPEGKQFNYTTEDYYLQEPIDDIVREYSKKDPVFKIERLGNFRDVVQHLHTPKFRALFVDGTFEKVEWIDQPPEDITQVTKLMRKMGAFYASYVK